MVVCFIQIFLENYDFLTYMDFNAGLKDRSRTFYTVWTVTMYTTNIVHYRLRSKTMQLSSNHREPTGRSFPRHKFLQFRLPEDGPWSSDRQ